MNAILMTYVIDGKIVDAKSEPCPAAPPTPTISENYGTLTCPVNPVSGLAVPPEGSAVEFVIQRQDEVHGWLECYRDIGRPYDSYIDMPALLPPGSYRICSRFVTANHLAYSQPSPWLEVTVPEPEPESPPEE